MSVVYLYEVGSLIIGIARLTIVNWLMVHQNITPYVAIVQLVELWLVIGKLMSCGSFLELTMHRCVL